MSWWDFGADPDRPRGGAAPGARRPRRIWLAAAGGATACAVIAGFAFWRVTAVPAATGPSWAPQPREIGGLHAVAAASRTQYSLYTAHGTVHFLPGIDLGATTPGNLPGQLAITPGDYARWLDEMGALGVRAIRIYTIHPPAFYTALASYDRATDPLPNGPPVTPYRRPRAAPATRVTAWTDASYIHLAIRFARQQAGRVTIGLDTIAAVTGAPPPGSTDGRADFALILDPGRKTGQAWVRDQLNPDQLDYKRIPLDALPHAPGWVALELVTNRPEVLPLTHTREPMEFQDAGLLRYGDWDPARRGYDSQALWHLARRVLSLRIPWAMAGMSDPSSHQALLPEGHAAETSVTIPGIGLTVGTAEHIGTAQQIGMVRWHNWQVVRYRERMKPGVSAIRRAFTIVSRAPVSRAARGRAPGPAAAAPADGG